MNKTISETIARALYDAGVEVLTYVPGAGCNEVFNDFNALCNIKIPLSLHEETAFTVAHGAAITGTRSAAIMKSHGIVKAGNSVTDSLYCGVTAGFLTIVCSDRNGIQSDSIMDIQAFLKGIAIPFEEADLNDIGRQIGRLFEESEKWQLPGVLVIDSHDLTGAVSETGFNQIKRALPPYQHDIIQRVLCPFFAGYQYQVLQNKIKKLDWRSITRPAQPRIPDALPEKWKPAAARYTTLFEEFRSIRGPLVCGDTGVSSLFACEPFNSIDVTTYMGGSLPLAIGGWLCRRQETWAVNGDFAFIAAGHLGLLEAEQRGVPVKVLILKNDRAETTGGQPIPDSLLDKILSGYCNYRLDIHNPQDRNEIRTVLYRASQSHEISIVVAHY